VSPYINVIAPFLVSRWHSHPAILLECCRFLSITPADFISFTLPHTLPQLFGTCDSKALEKVSKDVAKDPSLLFISHAQDILAYVFLLQGQAPTNLALAFIMSLLTKNSEKANIDIQSVIKSYLVPLLAKLVNVLGDEDGGKVQTVSNSITLDDRGQK
jgi:serine/threonine-protein kinase ATR